MILEKIFKILGILFLMILSTAGVVLILLWVKPEILVNQTTLRWAQRHFFPEYQIPWEQMELSLKKGSPGTYLITLKSADFCMDFKAYGKACFDRFDTELEVGVSLRSSGINSFHIRSLFVRDREISLVIPSSPVSPTTEKKQDFDWEGLRENLKKIKVGKLDVVLDHTILRMNGKDLPLNVELNESLLLKVSYEGLVLKGNVHPQSQKEYSFSFQADSFAFLAQVDAKAIFPEKDALTLRGSGTFQPKSRGLKEYLKSFSTHFDVGLKDGSLSLKLDSLQAKLNQKPLTAVTVDLCQSSLSLAPPLTEEIPIDCDNIQLKFALSDVIKMKDLPQSLSMNVHAEVPGEWIRQSPTTSKEALFVQVESKPVHRSFFDFFFKAETRIYHDLAGWNLKESDLSARLLIPKYERLVNELKNTAYAIPAPFHQMKGHLEARIVELPHRASGRLEIPFQIISDLKDSRNAVVGRVQGNFLFPRDLQVNVDVDQLHIQLPPFDPIRGIPPLVLDSRIQPTLKEKEKAPSLPLNLQISLKTTRPDSIRVYYHLLDPYAGFGLKAQLDKELSFQVNKSARPFDINYLKRSVTVLDLKLSQTAENKPLLVNGKLLYRATGYNIFIDFSGPMDRPEVVLSSDPPLDRRDIISVLLYNRVNSEIASFEQENVGGTEAALTDRAVGLFGLWAFASTPIEAVSYNSVTKTYSAQIKLPQGFRFSIGTNWESVQNLELRRRLRGNWFVSTVYRPETDQEQGRGEIMLQRKTSY